MQYRTKGAFCGPRGAESRSRAREPIVPPPAALQRSNRYAGRDSTQAATGQGPSAPTAAMVDGVAMRSY